MSSYLSVDGVQLHYFDVGKGRPILMLHGWGDNAEAMKQRWEVVIPWPDDVRRIYLDLPGHGRSGVSESFRSSDGIVRATLEFGQRLFGGEPFGVLGHSYGGYIAQGLVCRAPAMIAGMCLLAPLVVAANEDRNVPEMEVIEDDVESHRLLDPDYRDYLDVMAVRNEATIGTVAEGIRIIERNPGNEDFLDGIRTDSSLYSFPLTREFSGDPSQDPRWL